MSFVPLRLSRSPSVDFLFIGRFPPAQNRILCECTFPFLFGLFLFVHPESRNADYSLSLPPQIELPSISGLLDFADLSCLSSLPLRVPPLLFLISTFLIISPTLPISFFDIEVPLGGGSRWFLPCLGIHPPSDFPFPAPFKS